MKVNKLTVALITALLSWSASGLAHHSIAAEYGGSNEEMVELIGVVSKVRWVAPHVEIYISGSGGIAADGEQWIINSHAPGLLARTYGIVRGEVNVGDTVRFLGWRSNYNVPRYHMRAISVNGGPLRSTHRPSDSRDLRDGTLGDIVPSPGVDEDDEYGSNLGNAAPPSEQAVATTAAAPADNSNLLIGIAVLLLVLIGVVLVRQKNS